MTVLPSRMVVEGIGAHALSARSRAYPRAMAETMREEVRLTRFSHGAG
jgi:hypothetical protein